MQNWNRYKDAIKWRLLQKLDCSIEEKRKVKRILDSKEYEQFTKADKQFFRKVWIINGVGPSYLLRFWKWIGKVSTFIFFVVDYERHDVNYFVGWTEKDRQKTDDGLLKYSLLSVFELLQKLKFYKNVFVSMFLLLLYTILGVLYIVLVSPFMILVFFAYFAVKAFWSKAFNFVYYQ